MGDDVNHTRRKPRVAAQPEGRGELVASLLLVLSVAFVAFLVFVELSRYMAVCFSSILASLALDAVARRLSFNGCLPHAASVGITLGLGLLVAGAAAWWIGPLLAAQFEELREQVPRGLDADRRWFEETALGRHFGDELPDLDTAAPDPNEVAERTGSLLGAGFTALADLLVFLVLAIVLALSPDRYTRGAVRLLPQRHRERGTEVLRAAGVALRRWLLARGALMVVLAVAVQILYQRGALGEDVSVIGTR